VLVSHTTDPFFNLATEDWIFRHAPLAATSGGVSSLDHILFLWRNSPTVVIGRNQNPWKECHLHTMEANKVTLARRSSGGGAVYQDLGNTNFTFLSSMDKYSKKNNTEIICRSLAQFGVQAEASGRNDILVNGSKVSGSAYKLSGQRAFHHGTLLINVDMNALQHYLNPNKAKLKSKGVESVRARVLNLKDANSSISHDSLSSAVIQEFFKFYGTECPTEILNENELRKEPYLLKAYEDLKDWNWRFGETPDFEHNLEQRFDWGTMDIHINSKDGRISEVKIFSDSLFPFMIDEIMKSLKGATYDKAGFVSALTTAAKSMESSGEMEAAKCIQELQEWVIQAI